MTRPAPQLRPLGLAASLAASLFACAADGGASEGTVCTSSASCGPGLTCSVDQSGAASCRAVRDAEVNSGGHGGADLAPLGGTPEPPADASAGGTVVDAGPPPTRDALEPADGPPSADAAVDAALPADGPLPDGPSPDGPLPDALLADAAGGSGGAGGAGGEGGAGGAGGAGGEGGAGGVPEACGPDAPACVPGPPVAPLCDVAPCAWSEPGEWAPAARVTWMNVPANAECATRAGCRLIGEYNGTALAGIIPLANPDAPQPVPGECGDTGLARALEPDDAGEVRAIILARLLGAEAGEGLGAEGPLELQMFDGGSGPDLQPFSVLPSSYLPGTMEPSQRFPDAVVRPDGLLTTGAGTFAIGYGIRLLPFPFRLEAARATGYVSVGPGGVGFRLTQGLVGGYLTASGIEATLIDLLAACEELDRPSFCDTLNGILPPGSCLPGNCEIGIALIQSFLGGFDSAVDADGTAHECDPALPNNCNAIGVCLQIEMDGVVVSGPAQ